MYAGGVRSAKSKLTVLRVAWLREEGQVNFIRCSQSMETVGTLGVGGDLLFCY